MATEEKPKKNGGARKGAGRKKGGVNKATKEKHAAFKVFKKKAERMANVLLKAQSVEALGYHKIIAIKIDAEGNKSVETVTNEKRIEKLLAEGELGVDYHIIVGKEPNFRASDSILNRVFGRPKETVEISGEGGGPIMINFDK